MAVIAQAVGQSGAVLTEVQIRETLEQGLGAGKYAGARLLLLIPDHTRTIPLPLIFRIVNEVLSDARQLDFMVALGTHPPLDQDALLHLVGISAEERNTHYKNVGLLNHTWDDPGALTTLGTLEQDRIKQIAGEYWHPTLGGDVDVRINRKILDYDEIIIIGPTFPHEVVGFSGGAKYLFPGISGPEMINVTHWLGALISILEIIGIKDTRVRTMINAAAECVPTPVTLVSMVVVGNDLAGLFVGDHLSAWRAAADLSSEKHVTWVDRPFKRVLSWAQPKYDELWTAAKAMYKLEPVVDEGGEIVVYAPHLDTVSHVHGRHIYEAGYHVLDYYLKQWDRFKHIPLGVLAHGTHFRGSGTYENGVERGRIEVTLSSKISAADCEQLALGYMDPASIDTASWVGREDEGILYVPKAGEMLYRVKPKA